MRSEELQNQDSFDREGGETKHATEATQSRTTMSQPELWMMVRQAADEEKTKMQMKSKMNDSACAEFELLGDYCVAGSMRWSVVSLAGWLPP